MGGRGKKGQKNPRRTCVQLCGKAVEMLWPETRRDRRRPNGAPSGTISLRRRPGLRSVQRGGVSGTGSAGRPLGRPVLIGGTACSARSSGASDRAASSLIPARSSSLFFVRRPSLPRRSFSSAIAAYSSRGMVKLSRTGLRLGALAAPFAGAPAAAAGLAGAVDLAGAFFFAAGVFAALRVLERRRAGGRGALVFLRNGVNGIYSLAQLPQQRSGPWRQPVRQRHPIGSPARHEAGRPAGGHNGRQQQPLAQRRRRRRQSD